MDEKHEKMNDMPKSAVGETQEEETKIENEVAMPAAESNCTMEYSSACQEESSPESKPRKKRRLFYRFCKRTFDIVASFCGLIVLSPVMLIIAIAIKAEDKGPAIFRTMRVGKDCKPFRFYKFRSMSLSAPEDCAPRLLHSEDYITKVGAFLRKTSLDEIPQLWCILKGDMSVIGPRPAGLSETDLISAREKTGANSVLPGLTGLAQVRGRDVLAAQVEKKAQVDGEYVKNRGFLLDIKIFFLTIVKVFKNEDVVEGTKAIQEAEEQEEIEG